MRLKPGFTLLECIIAVFLIGAVLLALVSVLPRVHRQAAQGKNRFLAAATAANILEEIRSLPYGRPVPDAVRRDRKFEQVVEGVRTEVVFRLRGLEFSPSNLQGNGPDPRSVSSRISLTLEWEEGTGASSENKRQILSLSGAVTR